MVVVFEALQCLADANGGARSLMDDSLTSHHKSMYKSQDVVQVNIPAESGEMGILANHVPSIEQLKPGLIEVIEESGGSKQFFRTCYGKPYSILV
jgi:F0F1-type ATP synthase epsilon subunit